MTKRSHRSQLRRSQVKGLTSESFCSSCTSKYVGEYCQHLNPCHTGPRCQNGGSCRVKESTGGGTPSFTCSCPVGFTASLCEIPMENACDSSPCFNGATCILKSLHEYVCTCATGYTGKTVSISGVFFQADASTGELETLLRRDIKILGNWNESVRAYARSTMKRSELRDAINWRGYFCETDSFV